MQILAVDESEKKAWRRSRRILAATLFRRGSRTFTGRLSQEGVRDLVLELKKAASKNTSIAIYKLTAHLEFELIARIGNTNAWGEEGWYANTVSSKVTAPGNGFSAVEKLMRTLLRLSALFHDLGKANQQFQDMLQGKAGAQHLRHELVSAVMMRTAFAGLENPFTALSEDTPNAFASLSTELKGFNVPSEGKDEAFMKEFASEVLQAMQAPGIPGLLGAVEYLVLTHHRQIEASVQESGEKLGILRRMGGYPSIARHLNPVLQGKVFDEGNLTVSKGEAPWQNKRWCGAVAANAKTLLQLLRDNPGLAEHINRNTVEWVKNISLVARPSLILADHLASAIKEPAKPQDKGSAGTSTIYANTCTDSRGKNVMADSLSEHLLKTRYAIDPYFKGMVGAHKPLPHWAPPKTSLLFAKGPARFQWQDEAAALIKATAEIDSRPFLALVVSSTGAGKTLGAPKLLAAACGNSLRYTCALGLRSLTLQTGAAYRKQLGTTEAESMTVVGDALYAKLSGGTEDSKEKQGSESLVDVDDLLLDTTRTGEQVFNCMEFDKAHRAGFTTGKVMAMTEVPILSCTVDHLMGASTLSKGTDTRLSLRLATADLVLDEIDSYSLEDLQALARLIHHSACHGRRIVLMSATVSDTVLKALHQAWRDGLAVWSMRTQRPVRPVVALVSNQAACRVVAGDITEVNSQLDEFLLEVGQVLATQPARTLAKAVPTGQDLRETYQRILDECITLARQHHTTCATSGEKISAGFARFNQVTHCRQFAHFLMEEANWPHDVDVKVQCYHRRMPLMHLTHIEKQLNVLWSRQDDQAIFSHPLVKNWAGGEKLKVVIVSTTSIQETGRDHDYDFAVTEPWSTRSLVQLAGRVRRHRPGATASSNVSVLSCELNQLPGAGKRTTLELGLEPLALGNNPTSSFAVFTKYPADAKASALWQKFNSAQRPGGATQPDPSNRIGWLSPSFFSTGIDARVCLMRSCGGAAPLSSLEHYAQDKRMDRHGAPGLMSVRDMLQTDANGVELSWNRHNHVVTFRRSSAKMGQITLDPATDFKSLVVVERNVATGKVETRPRCPGTEMSKWAGGTRIKNVSRCLIRTDLLTRSDVEAALGEQAKSSFALRLCHSFEVYLSGDHGADTTPIDFDPLLGADSKTAKLP